MASSNDNLLADRQLLMIAAIAGLLGLVTALVFNIWPGLDPAISGLFFNGNGFYWNDSAFLDGIRWLMLRGFTVWYIFLVVAFVLCWEREVFLGLRQKAWLFLIATAALGPGLLVNGILKRFWGRARPREVEQFAGDLDFTTVLQWSNECTSNCSFVSGEVASMAMTLFGVAMVAVARRRPWYVIAILGTVFAGWMRVVQGGHFTSDAIFAGVLMVLLGCAVYWVIYHGDRFAKWS